MCRRTRSTSRPSSSTGNESGSIEVVSSPRARKRMLVEKLEGTHMAISPKSNPCAVSDEASLIR